MMLRKLQSSRNRRNVCNHSLVCPGMKPFGNRTKVGYCENISSRQGGLRSVWVGREGTKIVAQTSNDKTVVLC